MLLKFLSRRVAVAAAVLGLAALFIPGLGPLAALGVLLGAPTALFRVWSNKSAIESGKRGFLALIPKLFAALLPFALLLACAFVDMRLFTGFAGGLLTLPLFICVNAVTEKFGFSHNNWGEAA